MDVLTLAMTLLPVVWPLLIDALFLQALPDITRPGLFFGITVDPQFRHSDPARTIRRRYSIAIWIATLIVMAVAVFVAVADPALRVKQIPLNQLTWLLQLAAGVWAYVRANRAARPHAVQRASVVQVELSTKPDRTLALLIALAVPIASLIALALWACLDWRDLPSRLPVHWSFTGPDRWVSTTPVTVTKLLALHAVGSLLFAVLAWGVLRGSRRIATSGEAGRREQRFRTRTVLLLLTVEYFSVFPAWAALLALPATAMRLWGLVFPAINLVLIARIILTGQGGSRGSIPNGSAPIGDRTDDRHWAWGLLYYNSADPAFLVEKRFGIGYTFNLAHPFAWALLMLIATIPLIGRFL